MPKLQSCHMYHVTTQTCSLTVQKPRSRFVLSYLPTNLPTYVPTYLPSYLSTYFTFLHFSPL